MIPGYNDREDHFKAIAALLDRYSNIKGVDLEPYHNLGEAKWEGLGLVRKNKFSIPEPDVIERWKSKI